MTPSICQIPRFLKIHVIDFPELSSIAALRFIARSSKNPSNRSRLLTMSLKTPPNTTPEGGRMKFEEQDFQVSVFIDELGCLPISIYLSKGLMQSRSISTGQHAKLPLKRMLIGLTICLKSRFQWETAITLTVLRIREVECIRMLSLLSYIDYNEVVETVGRRFVQDATFQSGDSNVNPNLALSLLSEYGLVKYCGQGNSISIETAVQSVMRTLLESGSLSDLLAENERIPEYWINVALEMICSAYPPSPLEDELDFNALYPITRSCLMRAEQYGVMTPRAATLHRRLGDNLSLRVFMTKLLMIIELRYI